MPTRKATVLSVIALILHMYSISSLSSTIECNGKASSFNGLNVNVQLNISLPVSSNNNLITLVDIESGSSSIVSSLISSGIGEIEVIERLGKAVQSRKHDLIITNGLSERDGMLIGFYMVYGSIHSIRVNLSSTEKDFTYFDTRLDEVIAGACKV